MNTRFLDEDEEGCLKGVLGVVRILQDAPADAQDHRPVTSPPRPRTRGIVPGDEALEQLRIGESRDGSIRQEAIDLPQCRAERLRWPCFADLPRPLSYY